VFLLAFLLPVHGLPPCWFTVPKTNITYDFFPLHATEFSAVSLLSGYWYQMWPCSNFAMGPQGTLCTMVQYRLTDPIAPVTIFDTTLQWSVVKTKNATQVQYTTANGGPPNCASSNKPRFATLQFTCTNGDDGPLKVVYEPPSSGCSEAPGYVFNLPTRCACGNYSCGMTSEPTCAHTRKQAPCVVTSHEVVDTPTGKKLILNQAKKTCGYILFNSPSIRTFAPEFDSCSATQLIGHRAIDELESLVKMLQAQATVPNVFFWDDSQRVAVLGPASLLYSE